ncbi:DUF7552 domain-containing protein [Halorarius litoreus]|uniref:DUF7552 domain-containing protein n=1 Tax=Halorarius litoreus TaxID=2962676 RepID=UPI0020CBDA58|nr:hypothetical protein [Halorarius litoreus]
MAAGSDTYESALLDARERVEALASDGGAFAVACADTGAQPPPVSEATFDSYEAAERARDAAVEYRVALRKLDPSLPDHDLTVCEWTDTAVEFASVRETTGDRRANGLPRATRAVTLSGEGCDEWLRVENAPVVDFVGPDALLDDEVVERQLQAMRRHS